MTNSGDNTVSVIDTPTNKVVATVPVKKSPVGVAVTPDGRRVYVTNSGDNTVSVISTTLNPPKVIDFVTVGLSPRAVAITPDGKHVYVTNALSDTVSVIATDTNKKVGAPVPVGVSPTGVGIMR